MSAPVGVGVDIEAISAFEALSLEKHAHFYERCFTAAEIAYCLSRPRPAQHFAARHAAKEATIKAFGRLARLAYHQIEVRRAENGAPWLYIWDLARLHPHALMAEYDMLVSLSHTDDLAAAVVVASRRGA